MEETKFKVFHDDTQDNVVSEISGKLKKFGLTIVDLGGGDGWQEYEIVALPTSNS
jgi:hypothetical protein